MTEYGAQEVSSQIEPTDELGREERSQSGAKRAYRRRGRTGDRRVSVDRFKPPKNSNEISVNRMRLASNLEMAQIGMRNASLQNKLFWGWYIISAGDVEAVGCAVLVSPLPDNEYHADIVFPVALDAEDRRDLLIEYAMGLAYHARFCAWGDWTE